MLDKIEQLKTKVNTYTIQSKEDLENYRLQFLSKKGEITTLFDEFKTITGDQKKEIGKALNILRQTAEGIYNTNKETFGDNQQSHSNTIDLTLPLQAFTTGSQHPISLVKNSILDIFESIGFTVENGP